MLHCLQHVPFEDLGTIRHWAERRGLETRTTHLFENECLPVNLEDIDLLVVLGGPMGVSDLKQHPWLLEEKRFLRRALKAGFPVLGICLGAQLLAECLGAQVTRNPVREIGWFEVHGDSAFQKRLNGSLSNRYFAFHWHGDTFQIPDGAIPVGSTDGCANQGFLWKERVLGLQFHLETTPTLASNLLTHCADEMDDGPYVQNKADLIDAGDRFQSANLRMHTLLDALVPGAAKTFQN